MTLTLKPPLLIAPNLEAGVQIGKDSWVTIKYAKRPGREHRTRYRWTVLRSGQDAVTGDDLQSGCGKGSLQKGMSDLLCFLSSFAEAWRPGREKYEGDNSELFPTELGWWTYHNSEEISMAQMEVEETEDCIVES